MKIFSGEQLRALDRFTIKNEPIGSAKLMQRAAVALTQQLVEQTVGAAGYFIVIGPGNNGNDGLLMAIELGDYGLPIVVAVVQDSGKVNAAQRAAYALLMDKEFIVLIEVDDSSDLMPPPPDYVVVDALFGSGLSRPLSGNFRQVVQAINEWDNLVVSIDIPSGMFADDNTDGDPMAVVRADLTLTIHAPKLAFLLADRGNFVGHWLVVDIGLMEVESELESPFQLVEANAMAHLLPERPKFSHKGSYGHALLLAGSIGKMGAARLAANAALRAGCGLVTAHVPKCGLLPLQVGEPEVMCSVDAGQDQLITFPDIRPYSAIGMGPGIGTNLETATVLKRLIQESNVPLVLDADALNLLGENPTWLHFLPKRTVLTPHPKEFDRMFGLHSSAYQRLMTQREQSIKLAIVIVLKGAHTSVAWPDGSVHINSTGNSGMATAGSGDVLTGVILALLSQGHSPEIATVFGVYLHGLSGDLALINSCSQESLMASDLVANLGAAFHQISEPPVSG